MDMEISRQPRRAGRSAQRSRGHRRLSMISRLLWMSPGAVRAPSRRKGASFSIAARWAGRERGRRWTAGPVTEPFIPRSSVDAGSAVEILNKKLMAPRALAPVQPPSGPAVKVLLGFIPVFTSLAWARAGVCDCLRKTPPWPGYLVGLSPSSPVLLSTSKPQDSFVCKDGRVRHGPGLSRTRAPGRTTVR